jgi:hypothetical protein
MHDGSQNLRHGKEGQRMTRADIHNRMVGEAVEYERELILALIEKHLQTEKRPFPPSPDIVLDYLIDNDWNAAINFLLEELRDDFRARSNGKG